MTATSIMPLTVHGLTLHGRRRPVLDSVDATFEAGVRTVVLGPNGAGKSTLMKVCHGLVRPDEGTVLWGGQPVEDVRGRLGFVFQHPVLLNRTVRANLDYALRLRHIPKDQRAERIAALLVDTGLRPLADRQAHTLSSGEQQLVALARAWITRPDILLLDEPTANLDPTGTREVEEVMAAMHAAGTTIILSTHDLGQARRLGDRIVFLHRGRMVEHSDAEHFFETPKSAEAAAFLKGELLR